MALIDDLYKDYSDRFQCFQNRIDLKRVPYVENRADNNQTMGTVWADYADRFARFNALGACASADVLLPPAVTAYVSAVAAVGGTVSPASQSLLSSALTTRYNGLVYADYSSKIRFFWCPLSDFAGMRVPIQGPTFTNVGYVSGDYNIQTGVTGGAGKRLETGVLPSVEVSNNTTVMGGAVTNLFRGWILGGGALGQFVGVGVDDVDQFVFDSYNNVLGQAGRITLAYTDSLTGFYFATRNALNNFTAYRNETLLVTNTGTLGVGTVPASNPFWIGDLNYETNLFQWAMQNVMDAASYGSALTRAEEISFSRMLNAIRTGRAGL